ncbi:CRISPR-associated helicase Cas3' [Actinocorallia sp. API 0066]|uniref:CRISPR-associated helicase Cas3' n=1 Tax=Actinocorallia sp. API 0066 TaxID=2896846 RepID=UPI001E3C1DE5|nr:CRISPR-associated helicase Cas3' [Actinocorallia sp. API 0066]MCD0452844.1 CRISPR-associated helicase Cas3' [Actinocorallia sp. API 0066]
MVVNAATRMGRPGLLIFEGPMGEGKTKGALAAAEVLAARFGADGLFVGMPTQATCDPIFSQVREWAAKVRPGSETQVALLHGKRRFNKEWKKLLDSAGESPDDPYGLVDEDDCYGVPHGHGVPERKAPAEWFFGAKRGLLASIVVGTIDQLLIAATRSKHVMLRLAGLMGKVVVLDEVHAADVYMSQFLLECLRWLGQANVPVVLLSATLAPAQRAALTEAYLAGAVSREIPPPFDLPVPAGYPRVTAVWADDGVARMFTDACPSWRPDLDVRVELLPESRTDEPDSFADLVELLSERLAAGGCALVIRNTVDRAQDTYLALRERFGEAEVGLLHGRLHDAHRADRAAEYLNRLGPSPAPRPRLILVATQIAEQSFDVDADLLVTDLAPVDLLLQRVGRLHRHADVHRPEPVSRPVVVVTGCGELTDQPPWMHPGSKAVYGRYPLLRAAALIQKALHTGLRVPGDVPDLVSAAYGDGDIVPPGWKSEEDAARADWLGEQESRTKEAEVYLLVRPHEHERPTLEGLHWGSRPGSADAVQAVVRDGEKGVEAVIVHVDDRGYRAWNGRHISATGEVPHDLLDDVLGGTIRLPARLAKAAETHLKPLTAWLDHPWLRHSPALELRNGTAQIGDHTVHYDNLLGLRQERHRSSP